MAENEPISEEKREEILSRISGKKNVQCLIAEFNLYKLFERSVFTNFYGSMATVRNFRQLSRKGTSVVVPEGGIGFCMCASEHYKNYKVAFEEFPPISSIEALTNEQLKSMLLLDRSDWTDDPFIKIGYVIQNNFLTGETREPEKSDRLAGYVGLYDLPESTALPIVEKALNHKKWVPVSLYEDIQKIRCRHTVVAEIGYLETGYGPCVPF